MTRTTSRITAMLIIYEYLINNTLDIDGIKKMIFNNSDDSTNLSLDENDDFMKELVTGTIDNQRKIDHVISLNLRKYTLDRLSIVDRSILELATYEILYTKTPVNIIIDEYVNMSKEYSEIDDYCTSKFNNAVLDSIAKGSRDGQ